MELKGKDLIQKLNVNIYPHKTLKYSGCNVLLFSELLIYS